MFINVYQFSHVSTCTTLKQPESFVFSQKAIKVLSGKSLLQCLIKTCDHQKSAHFIRILLLGCMPAILCHCNKSAYGFVF